MRFDGDAGRERRRNSPAHPRRSRISRELEPEGATELSKVWAPYNAKSLTGQPADRRFVLPNTKRHAPTWSDFAAWEGKQKRPPCSPRIPRHNVVAKRRIKRGARPFSCSGVRFIERANAVQCFPEAWEGKKKRPPCSPHTPWHNVVATWRIKRGTRPTASMLSQHCAGGEGGRE